jgi:hypothetical protein
MNVRLPADLLSSAWQEPRSWRVGVKTTGDGDWGYNALRFATMDEAVAYARDLAGRWTAVREVAAHRSDDAPNYAIVDGAVKAL